MLVGGNVYSVHSRLRGEDVEVRVFAERLEVWYAQRKVEERPRLRGKGHHHINYRHIIDWLVRKPGAFEQYRYRDDLFPSSRFRIAYDVLKRQLAARETEAGVDDARRILLNSEGLGKKQPFTAEAVEEMVHSAQEIPPVTDVVIDPVDLAAYDQLLSSELLSNESLCSQEADV